MIPESYRWVVPKVDETKALKLARNAGFDLKFARLLIARGIEDEQSARIFLNPGVENMYSPFLMKGMEEAAVRIVSALQGGEKICIYGDYDVDGITATSILYIFFRDYMTDCGKSQAYVKDHLTYYLPDRMTEGYGLNADAIRSIAGENVKLVITVDTGITAIKECALASELGMDLVVTDHHECLEELPAVRAVVDAKQKDETYPFKYLAGCGVAYKLACALKEKLGYKKDICRLLELAAVGTVADIVELTDENRIIVAEGFRRMKSPKIMGLRKLLEAAGYDFKKKISSGFIGFTVAPRLNASGRMGDASRGVSLFTTSDEEEAGRIAQDLENENTRRKETEQQILEQVQEKIDSSPEVRNSRVIIAAGEGWHHGVIGIVSSRIKDRYYRPNIIFGLENGMATGSARSIPGFDLFKALCSCSDLFVKFGGHAAAAGMTLKEENLPELNRRLNEYAAEHMTGEMLTPFLETELELDVCDANLDLISLMEKMEPFGQGMPQPIVSVRGSLAEIRRVGADQQTVRMRLTGDMPSGSASGRRPGNGSFERPGGENGPGPGMPTYGGSFEGPGSSNGGRPGSGNFGGPGRSCSITSVMFRKPELASYYWQGMDVEIAGNLSVNHFNGRDYPQLIAKDMHINIEDEIWDILYSFSLRAVDYSYEKFCRTMPLLSSDTCQNVYRMLKKLALRQGSPQGGQVSLEEYARGLGERAKGKLHALLTASCVFEELGLINLECSGPYMKYEFVAGKNVSLKDSLWYQKFFEK